MAHISRPFVSLYYNYLVQEGLGSDIVYVCVRMCACVRVCVCVCFVVCLGLFFFIFLF